MLCVYRELGFWGGGGICRPELGIAPVGLRLYLRLGVIDGNYQVITLFLLW